MTLRGLFYAATTFALVATVAFVFSKSSLTRYLPERDDSSARAPSQERPVGENVLDRVLPGLKTLFPGETDWRHGSSNVVFPNEKGFIFIFKGNPTLSEDKKQATFHNCAFVFLADAPELDEQIRQALVVETPERVTLFFSKPIDNFSALETGRIDFSAFERGFFSGSVVIRSAMRSPTAEDDIRLETHSVVFTEKQIHTNLKVSFTFGSNGGEGEGLTIDLNAPLRFNASPDKSGDVSNALAASQTIASDADWRRLFEKIVEDGNLGGGFAIEQIELETLYGYFRFDWNGQDWNDRETPNAPSANDAELERRIEVRCANGVYFAPDFQAIGGWCVKFNEEVEVVAYQNREKTGLLSCDTLYLYLQDVELEKLAQKRPEIAVEILNKAPTGRLARLEPTILRAQGAGSKRAQIKGPSNDAVLTADSILYRVLERQIETSANSPENPVQILDGRGGKFWAKAVVLELDEKSNLKSLVAGENGGLETVLRDSNADDTSAGSPSNGAKTSVERRFWATWQNSLRIAPDENRDDALKTSTAGGVEFFLEGVGLFKANEANFWGKIETAQNKSSENSTDSEETTAEDDLTARFSKMTPLGASFRGDVALETARGVANISDSIDVRFGKPNENAANNVGNASNVGDGPKSEETIADATTENESNAVGGDFFSDASILAENAETTFAIKGRKLDLWCLLRDDATNDGAARGAFRKKTPAIELYCLRLEGGVSLVESSKLNGLEETRLDADLATIYSPGTKRTRVELAGAPVATFQTKELRLFGGNVEVDCAQNRFHVDGPGKLTIEPPKDATRQLAENNELLRFFSDEPADVVWSQAMSFNGSSLEFQAAPGKNVTISQSMQKIDCSLARLTLARPVSIFDIDVREQNAASNSTDADARNNAKQLDVELIECVGSPETPVKINAIARGDDANEDDEEYYHGVFQHIAFRRSTGVFEANGGGSLRATLRNSEKNSSKIGDVVAATNASKNVRNPNDASDAPDAEPKWTRFHLTFAGKATGSLVRQNVATTGGVRAVACKTDDRDAPLDVANRDAFPKGAAYLTAVEARVQFRETAQKSGDPKKSAPSVEVQASRNVVFHYDDAVGYCDELSYVSDKNVVILSGSGANKVTFSRQQYSGANRDEFAKFTRMSFNLDTEEIEVENPGANVN